MLIETNSKTEYQVDAGLGGQDRLYIVSEQKKINDKQGGWFKEG